ncbi:MAG: Crp/Fnr family transcriptional regulator [Oscillospiraceae bacterium]|nr:Crp/Fnr family transcriptional regulator [Oscillospiraceae bacterium]
MPAAPQPKEAFFPLLPFWKHLSPEEKKSVTDRSSVRSFNDGQIISSSDTSCMGIVLILEGGIRVCLLSEEGREITLYRLEEGDCCVTTASCVIRQISFDTVVYAHGRTSMLVIPSDVCQHLSESNIYLRCFLYETETGRFSQAIWVIQQILFRRFDQRLADYLLSESEKKGTTDLKMTQEEIARDVNSAREVVARMLRHFSAEGLVEVRRGHLLLLNPDGLRDLL